MNLPGMAERATLRLTRRKASPIGVSPSQKARSEAWTLDIMIEAGNPFPETSAIVTAKRSGPIGK